MAEENQANTEVAVMEVAQSFEVPIGTKEEEDTSLDGEFIKVEKEPFDVKRNSHATKATAVESGVRSDIDPKISDASSIKELMEVQEKVKELEIELDKVTKALKGSESENVQLKGQLSSAKGKAEQMAEGEDKLNMQIKNLQEDLEILLSKHKEHSGIKEAFEHLNVQLETSKKNMEELEHELQSSVSDSKKFEDLHLQSALHLESETKRAEELERLVEAAKLSAKEAEDQMASLQEELKGLRGKILENDKLEASLKSTTVKLSAKDSLMDEIYKEVDLVKNSERQLKENMLALESLLASTQNDLQLKVSELEEIQLKLSEEVSAKESVEASFNSQEEQALKAREEIAKVGAEKEGLEAAVAELTNNIEQMKSTCAELETKLKLSKEEFGKADAFSAELTVKNVELGLKLKSFEELLSESKSLEASASQKHLEFEDLIRAANSAAETARLQLQDSESKLEAVELKNKELEQQLTLFESKHGDTDRDLKEHREKLSELHLKLKDLETEKEQMHGQMQEHRNKAYELESAFSQSSYLKSELEAEIKNLTERCAEHEGRATATHERSLELEGLIQSSHSKIEDSSIRASELELLLETDKSRIKELEQEIETLNRKCEHAISESQKYSDTVPELTAELEKSRLANSSLENAVVEAAGKEKELTESLNVTTMEKGKSEEALHDTMAKLEEAENLLVVLRSELNVTHGKLVGVENDLKATVIREGEIVEKLKSAECQLENITNKESEMKSLCEKLELLRDQMKAYEDQLVEAASKAAALSEELDRASTKGAYLESSNEELKKMMDEAENRAAQSHSENELLAETNSQLKSKVDELQRLFDNATAEKEEAARQLASHVSTLAELTNQHARSSELQSGTESRILQIETLLQETIEKLTHKELEAKELNERFSCSEEKIKGHEIKVRESFEIVETRKIELDQTHVKVQDQQKLIEVLEAKLEQLETHLGALAEANMKLNEELAASESKLNDLQLKLSAALADKDDAVQNMNSSMKIVEDLTQELASERQRLQTEISSIMEQKEHHSETNVTAQNELQTLITQLEGQLKEHQEENEALKADLENLRLEAAQNSALQARVKELEEKLLVTEADLKKEVESVQASAAATEVDLNSRLGQHMQKTKDDDAIREKLQQLQHELASAQSTITELKEENNKLVSAQGSGVKQSSEELEAKTQQVVHLEKYVKELEQKLHAESMISKEPGEEAEVRSRDIGSKLSSPTKRKSKESGSSSSTQTPSGSTETHTKTIEAPSSLNNLKLVLGVALVSIIIGLILGKRY